MSSMAEVKWLNEILKTLKELTDDEKESIGSLAQALAQSYMDQIKGLAKLLQTKGGVAKRRSHLAAMMANADGALLAAVLQYKSLGRSCDQVLDKIAAVWEQHAIEVVNLEDAADA